MFNWVLNKPLKTGSESVEKKTFTFTVASIFTSKNWGKILCLVSPLLVLQGSFGSDQMKIQKNHMSLLNFEYRPGIHCKK